mmetsp:Transcript_88935/g.226333  ORF Transcript_88935/g.226333 Transcript_88935/m.226333 type:complete len:84 (+) Transcript_88935:822-1073(+)
MRPWPCSLAWVALRLRIRSPMQPNGVGKRIPPSIPSLRHMASVENASGEVPCYMHWFFRQVANAAWWSGQDDLVVDHSRRHAA